MSLLNYGLRGNIVAGLAVGIGALLVVPVAVRMLSGVLRPVAEGAVKGGAFLYDTGMKWSAGAWDSVSGMMAEAQSAISDRRAPAAQAAGSAVAAGAKPGAPAPKRARARIRAPRATAGKTAAGKNPAKKPARKPATPEA
jgi:hypothetical protein